VDSVAGAESSGAAGTPRDAIRAGNAEREQVVQRLNRAFGEGRLELVELEERVAQAYAAKTLGELRPLTADLPPETGAPPAAPQAPPSLSRPATVQDLKQVALDLATSRLSARLERDRDRRARWQQTQQRRDLARHQWQQRHDVTRQLTDRHPVVAWAAVSLVCFVIWLITALTGGGASPWFLWVAGPWGALLLARHLAGRHSSP
jgi:hypothetical protein